jgi:hypothetical protein
MTAWVQDRLIAILDARVLPVLAAFAVAVFVGYAAAQDPDTLEGLSRGIFWAGLLLALFYAKWRSGGSRWRMSLLALALGSRIPLAFAHLTIFSMAFGGAGDFHGYVSRALTRSLNFLEGDITGLLWLETGRGAELSMEAVGRLLVPVYFMVGANVAGMFFVSGLVGFGGSYLFLRAFEIAYPAAREARFMLLMLFYFPSLVFWTSILGKDSWIYFFLGSTTYALVHVVRAITVRHFVLLAVSVTFVTLIRPAIGVVVVFGAAAALVLSLQGKLVLVGHVNVLRPVIYIGFAGVIVLGTMALTRVMPLHVYGNAYKHNPSVVEGILRIGVQKHVGLATDPTAGGSSTNIAIIDTSTGSLGRFLPLAILGFLFRPLMWEAHNLVAKVAAIDSMLLMAIVVWRWRYLVAAIRQLRRDPFVTFCWISFGVATAGLSFESNFGAIVRHRTMVIPFLFLLVAIPRTRPPAAEARTA